MQKRADDMSNKTESATDEDDEAFQAWVRRAVSPLREMLKREYDERVKGRRVMRLCRLATTREFRDDNYRY